MASASLHAPSELFFDALLREAHVFHPHHTGAHRLFVLVRDELHRTPRARARTVRIQAKAVWGRPASSLTAAALYGERALRAFADQGALVLGDRILDLSHELAPRTLIVATVRGRYDRAGAPNGALERHDDLHAAREPITLRNGQQTRSLSP